MSLRSYLGKIQDELKKRDKVREEAQRIMRKATRLSKQAILFIHQERLEEAEELLSEAEGLFEELDRICKVNPDLMYAGVVDAAHQEYAEARIFLGLVKENRFLSPEEVGASGINYVLGLADVIGELRRRSLDAFRKEDVYLAEKCLEIMEQIYMELTAMDDAYMLVPGLRRKCDVARRIIEATRGDVTIEFRRNSMKKAIKSLEKTLKEKLENNPH